MLKNLVIFQKVYLEYIFSKVDTCNGSMMVVLWMTGYCNRHSKDVHHSNTNTNTIHNTQHQFLCVLNRERKKNQREKQLCKGYLKHNECWNVVHVYFFLSFFFLYQSCLECNVWFRYVIHLLARDIRTHFYWRIYYICMQCTKIFRKMFKHRQLLFAHTLIAEKWKNNVHRWFLIFPQPILWKQMKSCFGCWSCTCYWCSFSVRYACLTVSWCCCHCFLMVI